MSLSSIFSLNWLAVGASGILSLVIGFVWYGPLFGKPWAAYSGWTDEKVKSLPGTDMARTYLLTLVAALVQSIVLALFSVSLGIEDAGGGLVLGLVIGLGIAAMAFATNFLFERRPLGFWLIVAGYEVVYLAAAGALLAVWR